MGACALQQGKWKKLSKVGRDAKSHALWPATYVLCTIAVALHNCRWPATYVLCTIAHGNVVGCTWEGAADGGAWELRARVLRSLAPVSARLAYRCAHSMHQRQNCASMASMRARAYTNCTHLHAHAHPQTSRQHMQIHL